MSLQDMCHASVYITRHAFLHLQDAILHPILHVTKYQVEQSLGADGFSEPTGRRTSARISQTHCEQPSSFPRHC